MPRLACLAACAACLVAAASVSARELTVALPPGPEQTALQGVYVTPFSHATGIATAIQPWQGGIDALRPPKAPEGTDPPDTWDVALVAADILQTGCEEGLFDKLDWSAIGGRDHYQQAALSDCGVGGVVVTQLLAWDREKFQGVPSWGDFFDVAKYPGRRGLRRDPRGSLEFALLADGVGAGDVYKLLRSGDGVDRAFHKLDQLRPYIVWWEHPEEAVRLLSSGDVLMASAPNGPVSLANRTQHRNLGLQWSGGLTSVMSWAVLKGSPDRALANQFLYFAGMPAVQARMLGVLPYPGLAKGTNELAASDLTLLSPTLPANLSAGLAADEGFWRENQDKLRQRFAAWLAN